MAKLTLASFASLQSGSAITALNNNFAEIITAFENTLSRDGTSPNSMSDNLDMNSNRISNLVPAVGDTEPVRLKEFQDGMDALEVIVQDIASTTQGYLNTVTTIYDDFDDRYLGPKASDPSVDNDGNALLTGAIYWNTVSSIMRVWTGTQWTGVISTTSGFVLNDLADVVITSSDAGDVLRHNGTDWVDYASSNFLARANHTGTQLLATISDVTITSTNLNTLDDGANTTLHFHNADRARSVHTGTQLASTISDFNEAAQDAVGAMVDTTLVYTDGTPLLSRAALTGAITASGGSNTTALGSFTISQLNTAISDGDVSATTHTHVLTAGATDVTITASNLNTLDDGVSSSLHYHDSDRSRTNHTGTQTASTVSDFNEAAQDAVGGILTTSSEIALTYSDATPSISATLVAGSIDESKLDTSVNASLDLADSASQPGHTHVISDVTGLQTALDAKQPLDADLTTIAGLTATSDNFIQAKSSAWASRTPTQVTADLIPFSGDSGSGGSKGLVPTPTAGDGTKFLKGDGTWAAIPGGGDALVASPLSQFAATSSLQLKSVMSDETGSGSLVFADGPQISTIELGHASDTTIGRVSAGDLSIEGNLVYRAGGTDVPIADGGTGQSTATAAFDALAPTTTQGDLIYHNGTDNVRLAAGTSGSFLKTNGAGANPEWAVPAGLPPGHIYGLTLSNAADTVNDITVAVGSARDEADSEDIRLTSSITKQLDASWSVGDNAGGLNTGTKAVSTWYEVHLIKRTDTGVVDVMFTTTADRATLPTNYTKSRQIGWIRNDSTSTILQFTQVEDCFILATPQNDANNVTATATAANITLTAPPLSRARFRAAMTWTDGDVGEECSVVFSEIAQGNIAPALATGLASLTGIAHVVNIRVASAGHFELIVDSSSQIEHDSVVTAGNTPTFDISTFGWVDTRKRFG